MTKCDYCGEKVAFHEIVDDDDPGGVAMLCDLCFARVGGVFAEMTADRMLDIVTRLVTDADSGYAGRVEDQHIDVAKKIVLFLSKNGIDQLCQL